MTVFLRNVRSLKESWKREREREPIFQIVLPERETKRESYDAGKKKLRNANTSERQFASKNHENFDTFRVKK